MNRAQGEVGGSSPKEKENKSLMGDEEEIEVVDQKNERISALRSLDDWKEKVLSDPENLCFIACLSKQCPYSTASEPVLNSLSELGSKGPTAHVRCFTVNPEDSDELSAMLRVSKVPMFMFYLKGTPRSEPYIGSNAEKLNGLFRNQVIKRNEEMKDYDEAKLAELEAKNKPAAEDGEGVEEEVEE